ncbi:MAG: hypothetical protein LBU88_00530 [Treponema sp.]|jgi:hypothetical protein|nr:hypothetical protein [Treponema sp.]
MKKSILVIVIALAVTAVAAAQNYTVQSITGRVQKEVDGRRVNVVAGETLGTDTVIHTGVGSSLVVREGSRTLTVPAARSGKVGELVSTASGTRINGNVARTDTGAAARTTGQVTTASARASDAAEDNDIAAE